MWKDFLSGPSPNEGVPTREDFDKESVRKAFMRKMLYNPLFTYPAALCVIFLFASLLFTNAWLAAISLVFGAVSVGAWIFNMKYRAQKWADAYILNLMKLRRDHMHRIVAKVEEKFQGFLIGQQAAKELKEAYEKLLKILKKAQEEEKATKLLDLGVQRLITTTEELYEMGIQRLEEALASHKILQEINKEKLEAELQDFEKQLENLKGLDGNHRAEIARLEGLIKGHKKRIEMLEHHAVKRDSLLAEVEGYETVFETTYMNAVELASQGSRDFTKAGIAEELERTVSSKVEVEKKLQGLRDKFSEEDEECLRAAEEADSRE